MRHLCLLLYGVVCLVYAICVYGQSEETIRFVYNDGVGVGVCGYRDSWFDHRCNILRCAGYWYDVYIGKV